jgi:hypothetical protein
VGSKLGLWNNKVGKKFRYCRGINKDLIETRFGLSNKTEFEI